MRLGAKRSGATSAPMAAGSRRRRAARSAVADYCGLGHRAAYGPRWHVDPGCAPGGPSAPPPVRQSNPGVRGAKDRVAADGRRPSGQREAFNSHQKARGAMETVNCDKWGCFGANVLRLMSTVLPCGKEGRHRPSPGETHSRLECCPNCCLNQTGPTNAGPVTHSNSAGKSTVDHQSDSRRTTPHDPQSDALTC